MLVRNKPTTDDEEACVSGEGSGQTGRTGQLVAAGSSREVIINNLNRREGGGEAQG